MGGKYILLGFPLALALSLVACLPDPSPPPAMPAISAVAGPVLRDDPGQVDNGAVVYWQVCMACHGDLGQGLTDEWRTGWGEEDMDCWQSKCHAANHPPWGFQLPQDIPPVIGMETMPLISNGLELHDVIKVSMPWWNPGSLSEAEAWEVTAYLLKADGALPDDVVLSGINAAAFSLHPTSPPPGDVRPTVLLITSFLVLAAIVIAIDHRMHKPPS